MNRRERTLDPKDAEHMRLIAIGMKARAGAEIYDDNPANDLPGSVEGIKKPELFRNVAWGAYVMDMSNDADFSSSPNFLTFVPGRIARRANGTVYDQKYNLVVKFTDRHGNKRILLNPPPHDWSNKEAISILNTHIHTQMRRLSDFRSDATPNLYIAAEHEWILAHLTDGKPTHGWMHFVDGFNEQFAGKTVLGSSTPRPSRSRHSLLCHVRHFKADFYAKGLVPVVFKERKAIQEQ
jgi:hypothetical protein